MQRQPRMPTPFADDVQRWTFEGAGSKHSIREDAALLPRYRSLLRSATRFVLHDDFVTLATDVSSEPNRVYDLAILARLPFDHVWLEYDLHTEMRRLDATGRLRLPFKDNEVSQAAGWLIVRDVPSTSRWVATEFSYVRENDYRSIQPAPVDLVFDPEGGYAELTLGSTYWRQKTLSRMPEITPQRAKLIQPDGTSKLRKVPPEWFYFGNFPDPNDLHADDELSKLGEFLQEKVAATPNPFWLTRVRKPGYLKWNLAQLTTHDSDERAGIMRRLIVKIALITSPPVRIMPIERRKGSYAAGLTRQPYLVSSIVTLTVPQERALEIIRDETEAEGRRRKRHRVRGHWRVVDEGHHPHQCRPHRPVMVEDGLGMCLGCERLIRWIPWHYRGDAALGYVEQTYKVET